MENIKYKKKSVNNQIIRKQEKAKFLSERRTGKTKNEEMK